MLYAEKLYGYAGIARLRRVLPVLCGLILIHPQPLLAVTCTQTATDAASIQTLIDAASSGDVICIPPATYQVNLTLTAGITLHGEELGRTILQASDNNIAIITGATGSTVENVILENAGTGISASSISDFTVTNLVLTTTTGISCDDATLTVSNVVLHNNTTGISCQNNATLTMTNTIISENTTDLELTDTTTNFTTNLVYSSNDSDTITYPGGEGENPLFVAVADKDFHLKDASPAKDNGSGDNDPDGTAADIGAYGGPNADVKPFPVSGLTITDDVNTVDTATVSWTANDAYNINGYKLYFDLDATGAPYEGTADEGTSSLSVTSTSPQLTGLGLTLDAPTDIITVPGNQTILISWNAVTHATGYNVSYGTTSGVYPTTVDAGDSLFQQISGLTNYEEIFITVTPYYTPTLYCAVTAVDDAATPNESVLSAEVTEVLSDSVVTGTSSSEVSETPETTVVFPDLKDEYNCFIATAAYGSSLEPQVVLLRKFRNQYLLTNWAGRHFVDLYYEYGPLGAAFINEHAWIKPVVRAALYPLIGFAWLCLKTGAAVTFLLLVLIFVSPITLRKFSRMKKCA